MFVAIAIFAVLFILLIGDRGFVPIYSALRDFATILGVASYIILFLAGVYAAHLILRGISRGRMTKSALKKLAFATGAIIVSTLILIILNAIL
ncbi:MAG: hypothetical protein N3F67_03275 [Acidilobaceae archaeon]|nr:hypothetical protein [Acidilobaceae archaeon]